MHTRNSYDNNSEEDKTFNSRELDSGDESNSVVYSEDSNTNEEEPYFNLAVMKVPQRRLKVGSKSKGAASFKKSCQSVKLQQMMDTTSIWEPTDQAKFIGRELPSS